jgi:hypothetical protein
MKQSRCKYWIRSTKVLDAGHTSLAQLSNAQAEQLDVALGGAALGSNHRALHQGPCFASTAVTLPLPPFGS